MASSPVDPQPAAQPKWLFLTPRQESLRDALAARSPEAARLYVGGLMVLQDRTNPCAVRLASMAMRELIDELARASGIAGVRGGSVMNRIDNLRRRVEKLATVLRVKAPSGQHVAKLLGELEAFFEREAQVNPSRHQKMRLVAAAISVGDDTPALVMDPYAEQLADLVSEFNAILHGSRRREHLERLIADFETVLLNLLAPQTFDDFASIDVLLQQGPGQ